MITKEIELHGHIIDSLILPKVMDEILARRGQFNIRTIRVGKEKTDTSYALIEVSAQTAEQLDNIITHLRQHGAEVTQEADVQLEESPADGVFPEGFYVTTNKPTSIHMGAKWIDVETSIMDSGICVDVESGIARTVKFCDARKGMKFVVGSEGVRVAPLELPRTRGHIFEFMSSSVSTEKPKGAIIREVAQQMVAAKKAGGRILVVGGPAIVHTGGGEHFEKLIKGGYVDLLFAGNALAVHDIECALFGTSLGVDLSSGNLAESGHDNHMRAINVIRAHGSIAGAVKAGVLRRGILYQCVKRGVDFVLAGSVRDDGPLPDVITDTVQAQYAMRSKLGGVSIALMMGTMLHSIATGNMLPATVKTICVDINPSVVTKLSDRGTFQAIGLVTDIEPFLRELAEYLREMEKEEVRST
jgi:lysine-ketoglutarate reductase/saccharopine dehydrogenase-like protein (TIGR00300 family)